MKSCVLFVQETEVIVSQVLDELGISLDHELSEITPGLDKPHVLQGGAPVRCTHMHTHTSSSTAMRAENLQRELPLITHQSSHRFSHEHNSFRKH